jgi:small G protein signaling modulator 1
MQRACDTMKRQILTRAFYGCKQDSARRTKKLRHSSYFSGIAHCRHLRTVRRHLSGLIAKCPQSVNAPTDASHGLTKEIWQAHRSGSAVQPDVELCRLVYFGGVEPSLRKEVWPCLLHYYQWSASSDERETVDTVMKVSYEDSMSEWMAVEAIIRQKDKEAMAASLAKITSQHSTDIPLVGKDSTLRCDLLIDSLIDYLKVINLSFNRKHD